MGQCRLEISLTAGRSITASVVIGTATTLLTVKVNMRLHASHNLLCLLARNKDNGGVQDSVDNGQSIAEFSRSPFIGLGDDASLSAFLTFSTYLFHIMRPISARRSAVMGLSRIVAHRASSAQVSPLRTPDSSATSTPGWHYI